MILTYRHKTNKWYYSWHHFYLLYIQFSWSNYSCSNVKCNYFSKSSFAWNISFSLNFCRSLYFSFCLFTQILWKIKKLYFINLVSFVLQIIFSFAVLFGIVDILNVLFRVGYDIIIERHLALLVLKVFDFVFTFCF
jgi:hypothetical protein